MGLVGVIYFSRAGERYFMWATIGGLILTIFALQAFGQVILRDGSNAAPDRMSQAMNGPRGLWVRGGLLPLVLLLILLGVGALELSTLVTWLRKLANAA
jgi:hypothetical protein